MTQVVLAEKSGVSKWTVINWEAGKRVPQALKLYQIASVLGTTPDYIMGETNDPTPYFTTGISELGPDSHLGQAEPENSYHPNQGGGIIRVPVLERAYSACCGAGFPNADMIYKEAIDFLDMPRVFFGAISPDSDKQPFMCYAEGDSMVEAGITDGNQILVNPAEEVYDGESALIEYGRNKDVAVKRIYWLDNGAIEIRSACGDGWKRTFSLEDQREGLLRIIGKVVWYGNKPKRG